MGAAHARISCIVVRRTAFASIHVVSRIADSFSNLMVDPSVPRRLIIATRKSPLALWQAEHIRARLRALYPACEVSLLGVTTQGDRIIDHPLADVGGKGLF